MTGSRPALRAPISHVCCNDRLASELPVQNVSVPFGVIRGACANRRCVLYLRGSLRAPLSGVLQHHVHTLLRRGERHVLLDVSAVQRIDASGVGELVRAYNTAAAAGVVLQVVGARAWVRRILELVGLFEILSHARGTTVYGTGTSVPAILAIRTNGET